MLPASSVVAGGDGPGGWSGQDGYRCPSLSGVPVPDWCSPGSTCSSRSLCTWGPPAPLGGLGEEGCLSSPRCSLPRWPVLGLPSPQCQTLGAFRLSWVFVRCSCEGIRLSPWPRLHPRGGVGRSWEAKEVASPRISAAGQLAQGGALWLTLQSACSSRRGSLTRP